MRIQHTYTRARLPEKRTAAINQALDELSAIQAGISGPLGVALVKTWLPRGFRRYPPAYCADVLELIQSALQQPQKWEINSEGEAVRRPSGNPNSYADMEPR